MQIRFKQDCTIYPDGAHPVEGVAGATLDVTDQYGQLLIDKGHADQVEATAEKPDEPAKAGPADTSADH
jgi:hypothetical protein